MTKKDVKDGIYIVCRGDYVGKIGTASAKKPYEVTIQLTDNPNHVLPAREDKILHLAQSKLLPAHFKSNFETFPDYQRWHTCQLVDVQVVSNGKEVVEETAVAKDDVDFSKMKRKDLVMFCAEHGLTTDPTDFGTIGAARSAVADEWENKLIAEEDAYGIDEKEKQKKEDKFAEFSDILEFNDIK